MMYLLDEQGLRLMLLENQMGRKLTKISLSGANHIRLLDSGEGLVDFSKCVFLLECGVLLSCKWIPCSLFIMKVGMKNMIWYVAKQGYHMVSYLRMTISRE